MPMFVRRPIRRRPQTKNNRAVSPSDGGKRAVSPNPGQQRRLSTPTLVLPDQPKSLTPQPGRRATLPFLPISPQPPRRRPSNDSDSSDTDDSCPFRTPSRENLQHSMLALIASPISKRAHSSSRLERRRERRESMSPASSDEDEHCPSRFRSFKSSENLAGSRPHSPRGSERSSPRTSPRGSPRATPTRDLRRRSSGDSSDRCRHSPTPTDRGRNSSDSTDKGAVFVGYDRRRRLSADGSEHTRHQSDPTDKCRRGYDAKDARDGMARHADIGRYAHTEPDDNWRSSPDPDTWRQSSIDRGRRSSDSERDRLRLAELAAASSPPVKESLARRRSGPADIRRHRRPERHSSSDGAKTLVHAPDLENYQSSSPSRKGSLRMKGRPCLTQIDERQSGDNVYVPERGSPRRSPKNLQHQISIEETDETGACIRVETIAMDERVTAISRHRSPRRSLPTPPTAKTLARVRVHHANSLNLGHDPGNIGNGPGHHRSTSPVFSHR